MDFSPGPLRTRAVAGAVAKWQHRQLRGEEPLRCPGRRSGAWSNPRLGQPVHPALNKIRRPRSLSWAQITQEGPTAQLWGQLFPSKIVLP
eukprot:1158691-Pelagomonas_calceolata.AAC.1